MMDGTRTSPELPTERAWSWPDRRRAELAAERADRVAQEGLERLRAKPINHAPPPDEPEPEDEPRDGPEVEPEVESQDERKSGREQVIEEIAAEVGRRLRLETADAVKVLQAHRDLLLEVVDELRALIADAREWIPSEPEEPALAEIDHSDEEPPAQNGPVDLNRGTIADLQAVGMSETQAARVIRHRDHWGEFHAVDELDHVAGFAPELRDELKQHLVVDVGAD
jgi:DNA uptake protein ComE-like DNA-binding protein